jgi:hypothetical protein
VTVLVAAQIKKWSGHPYSNMIQDREMFLFGFNLGALKIKWLIPLLNTSRLSDTAVTHFVGGCRGVRELYI